MGVSSDLYPDLPEVRVVDTGHEQPLGDLILVSLEPGRLTPSVSLLELCCDPLCVPVVKLPPTTVEQLMVHPNSPRVRPRLLEVGIVVDKVGSCVVSKSEGRRVSAGCGGMAEDSREGRRREELVWTDSL